MICEKINIWNNKDYKGDVSNNNVPYMTTYIHDGAKKRQAVLILPGGGYGGLSEREAEPVALKFVQKGYNAFILYYSVAPNHHPLPIFEASLAMSIIRDKSGEWNIISNKIFVCGFSAGGHLAASLGVHWNKAYIKEALGIEEKANKPDGLILCYPVIVYGEKMHEGSFINLLGANADVSAYKEMSLEEQVGKHTPPTFIWHTFCDKTVPIDNSLLFAEALKNNGIPFELHIYSDGGHGMALANEETAAADSQINDHVASWIDLCFGWMKTI